MATTGETPLRAKYDAEARAAAARAHAPVPREQALTPTPPSKLLQRYLASEATRVPESTGAPSGAALEAEVRARTRALELEVARADGAASAHATYHGRRRVRCGAGGDARVTRGGDSDLDGAARGDAATREMCNQEANRAAAYASRASHGLARDFGSSTGVDAADVCWALGIVSSRAMGGSGDPTLVPLLDLCNHDASGAPFTSFDTSGARVATRLSARKRRAGDASSASARTAVTDENWRSDGDDWCLWSWRSGDPRALAAGDEIYADYGPEYSEPGEWFANTGFVPKEN